MVNRQPRIDGVRHPAAGGDGKIDLQMAAVVPCQRGAAGARRQPQRRQRRCQPLSTAGHLPQQLRSFSPPVLTETISVSL